MKDLDCNDCQVHVLICTNDRQSEKPCCARYGGQDFYLKLKSQIKDAGLYDTHWVTRTGCLGFCNPVGTTVAIQRKNMPTEWFNEVTQEDFNSLWKEITK